MFQKLMNSSQEEQALMKLTEVLPFIITSKERLIFVNTFLRTLKQAGQKKDEKMKEEIAKELFTQKHLTDIQPTQDIAENVLTCISEYAQQKPEHEHICYHFLMYLSTENEAYMKASIFDRDEPSKEIVPKKDSS